MVVDPDPAWPEAFARVRGLVVGALGPAALSVTHVGSKAVPGLAAKDFLDLDPIVADSAGPAQAHDPHPRVATW